jgi:signal transduction histidine kinase
MVRDITERKKIERMKAEFVSTVSHELRTPLTSIRGSLGLIMAGVAGALPEQARELVGIAHKNSDRLTRLINDILDMERIESGKMRFDLKPQHLMPIVEQAVEAIRGYGQELGVGFEIVASQPAARVNVDADRLLQVLANLLSNAAKFSPRASRVEVAVSGAAGNKVRVAVADRGPGIPEEFRGGIFQKFSQADASDTRAKGGSGLGLSISKAIVEKLGGEIAFESIAGMGTTFYVDLPALPPKLGDGRDVDESQPAHAVGLP